MDPTSDEAEVRDVVERFDEALEHRDLATAMSMCTNDVVFIGSGEGEQAVGQEAVVRMVTELAPRSAGTDFTIAGSTLDVSVYGDVALVTSFGTAELRSPRRIRTGPYRLTGTLLRVDGTWKWAAYHGSEPLPW